jgi:hypothetical protein
VGHQCNATRYGKREVSNGSKLGECVLVKSTTVGAEKTDEKMGAAKTKKAAQRGGKMGGRKKEEKRDWKGRKL